MSEFQTTKQVQELLQVSKDTVLKLISDGDIKAIKIKRCVRIDMQSVEHYIDANTMGSKQPEA